MADMYSNIIASITGTKPYGMIFIIVPLFSQIFAPLCITSELANIYKHSITTFALLSTELDSFS